MAAESLCKACGKIPLLSMNSQRNNSSSIANNCGQGACKAQFRKGKHMFLSAALPYSSSLHHNFAASPSYFRSSSSIKSARKMDTVCEQKVKVHFILKHQVRFGEHHAILGSATALGKWKKKTMMSWTESGWVYDLETDGGERIEYKFVIVSDSGKLIWEGGENRVLELPREGSFQVACQWDNTREVIELNAMGSNVGTSKAVDSRKKLEQGNGKPNIGTPNKALENSPFVNEWQGRQTSFMRSNDHSNREQQRVWNTTGLQGPASKLVEGDQRARNWWRKLDIVRELLTGEAGKNDRFEALINSAIYLKWINTGQIPCFEDGGHYRPNKHAEISRSIFCELEAIVSESTATPQEVLVIRKIHPCLPSFKSEFTASVPLTRIRDIAHRNDIPHDLKQEIKHTIQNKLHRNAGPEDLIATEAMLKRVTNRPGEYSEAFVEQLKIFFNELKDFFNAGSLTEQLDAIKSSLDQQGISALTAFLDSKKRMDQLDLNNNTSSDKVMEELTRTLHTLTGLREILVKELQTGLKNDSSATAIATHQKWRLSEIGLEDYSFVLLSRFVNALEAGGGSSQLIREAKLRNSSSWDHPIGALVTAIRQLGLSGWRQSECIAIENELQCWQQKGITKNEGKEDGVIIWALRMKATLDRVCRFTESYSDTLLQIFPDKVQKLGKAFGIPENTVRTYTEAEIRASVVFQISKLCSLLLKSVRSVSGSHGWDTLVPGKAIGTLLEVEKIVPGSLPPALTGPIILIVRKADGDEEVKAAGENIAGVVLLQELPHLSHLGVRARQEKVVFVTCEDEDQIANLRKLRNQFVRIEASSEKVEVVASSSLEQKKELVTAGVKNTLAENIIGSETGKKKNHTKPAGGGNGSQSQVIKKTSNTVLKLDSASMDSCGAKATSCGRLAVLAGLSAKVVSNHGVSASFRVPKGIVIPFGAMEAALESSGSLKRYQSLIEQIENAKLGGGGLDALCSELQVLVAAQRPSKPALDSIAKSFLSDARLIVRSSANVEDLAGMSGAGLYDSIPNVRASEIETFGKAVAQVWASLYTRRAVLSRRVAGVPQREATMAVLVQEMLAPELSFVLHTVSPVDRNESVVEAEIAPGLGETLASGTRGTPWRLAGNKFDATVKTQAFANFSEELAVVTGGAADGNVKKLIVDYSKKPLTLDPIFRQQFGQRLATIGFFIEQKFACPQDVEGCLVGNDVFIVQARPQP